MTPTENLMKTVLEAWGQADLKPIREALDKDVVWKSAASVESGAGRFGGVHKGQANVIALLSILSTEYFNHSCVAREVISKGDVVWGLFDVQGSFLPAGGNNKDRKQLNVEMVFRWRVRDGKIVEAQTFFDTAGLLAQQGQRQSPPA